MPILSHQYYELRFVTFKAVQKLLEDGFKNERSALQFVIIEASKHNVLTGFDKNFNKAYNQYRQFKFHHTKCIITQYNIQEID